MCLCYLALGFQSIEFPRLWISAFTPSSDLCSVLHALCYDVVFISYAEE